MSQLEKLVHQPVHQAFGAVSQLKIDWIKFDHQVSAVNRVILISATFRDAAEFVADTVGAISSYFLHVIVHDHAVQGLGAIETNLSHAGQLVIHQLFHVTVIVWSEGI